MGVNVSENQNPTGSDAVGVDPVGLAADRWRCSTLDTCTVEAVCGMPPSQLIGLWSFVPLPHRLLHTAYFGASAVSIWSLYRGYAPEPSFFSHRAMAW